MSKRPAIDRILADLLGSTSIEVDEVDTAHAALHDAYNAGAAGITGETGTVAEPVDRFVRTRPISFADAMGCTPIEHLVEYEQWRRLELSKPQASTDVPRLRALLDLVLPCVERDAAATEDAGARQTIASCARAIREELGLPEQEPT